MKILMVLIGFLLLAAKSLGNPIVLPQAYISEFSFTSDTQWALEITFFYNSAYRGHEGIDSVSYGNNPGSSIGRLLPGYSICRLNFADFCKDKSPTIGFNNDTTGACGTLTGYLFDKNGTILSEGTFLLDNVLVFNDNHKFSIRILARNFVATEMYEIVSLMYHALIIDPLFINMDPDSLIEKNIHLVNYVWGIEKYSADPSLRPEITNYPNPFNSSTTFSIRIPANVRYHAGIINIFSAGGKKIYTLPLSNSSQMRWTGQTTDGESAPSGVYFYQLLLDNVVCKSGSMILLK